VAQFRTHQRWWEEYSDRFQSELESLDRQGIRYELDEEARSQGILRLNLFPLVEGRELHLTVIFPDSYPYFPFEVRAPDIRLPYHQHARVKSLCLLPRNTRWWQPASDRIGDFISERLPTVLESGASDNISSASEVEEHQAEPYSDYYLYHRDSLILVDSGWKIPALAQSGTISIGVTQPPAGTHPGWLINGALLLVTDEAGRIVAEATPELARLFPVTLDGRWVRVDTPVEAALSEREIFYKAEVADPRPELLKAQTVRDGGIRIRGVVYPEEIKWRGVGENTRGDAWLFTIELLPSPYAAKRKGKNRWRQEDRAYYLARPGRGGRSDFSARIPELRPLSGACVALFGVGCIGAPSALEFARAGLGELRLLDSDVVDPATVVRWPLGLSASGRGKVQIISRYLNGDYPYTRVDSILHKIGAARTDGPPEQEIMARMLDGASLVYDATAEYGVQHFLSDQAQERGLPYIGIQASQGGWGGLVLRIRPGATEGCWNCAQLALADGTLQAPPWNEATGEVQPAGCADPTFTAANFDTMEVALTGVRGAVSVLCSNDSEAYPAITWDVAVLSLRNEGDDVLLPRWSSFQLRRHPACQACARTHDK
jgi:ThiF family protein/E2/UBC family protein B